MGEAIARRQIPKVLLLNGSHDRETSAGLDHGGLMAATDVVRAICSALNRQFGRTGPPLQHLPGTYITTLLYPRDGAIPVDRESLSAMGIRSAWLRILVRYVCMQHDKEF